MKKIFLSLYIFINLQGGPEIKKTVIKTNNYFQVELYPIPFQVYFYDGIKDSDFKPLASFYSSGKNIRYKQFVSLI